MSKYLIFLAVALTGCAVFKKGEPEYYTPVVFGERVNIVKELDIIEVPALKKPAKTWFLVDDVGLSIWLGIPYNHIPNGQTAFDSAMEELDSAEDLTAELERRLNEWRQKERD